jgi:serine-type D-Ala-D-Ala carboxypeptidase/endopeptidase (penicillin-binding protein 4)
MAVVRRRGLTIALALLLLGLIAASAGANTLPLTRRLASALAVPGAPARYSGVVAVDLLTGHTLFARNADLPLAPASNEKLLVTYTALHELGLDFRFRTELLGRGTVRDGVFHGNLVLKGFGDPTLTSADLLGLVRQLKRQGIDRIDGRVLGDDSWFDEIRTAPGWKPSFSPLECPPISALVVDGDDYENHLALDPPLAAAGRLRQLLRSTGIAAGPVAVGPAAPDSTVLGVVESQPLVDIVKAMDTSSDNFTAEMLVKEIGAEVDGDGSTAAGLRIVLRDLGEAGVPLQGVRLYDGSGLSDLDRVTADTVASLLLVIWRSPTLRQPIWSALPIAGETGTLEYRLEQRPARGAVRAKTGTTDLATALSGYVDRRYAFSVLDNGYPVSWNATREAQDRFATALAASG